MPKRGLWLLVALLLWLVPTSGSASELLDHERYSLDNGLDVVLVEDQRLPLVAMDLSYHVGSAHDGAHAGLAHLTEHLMFRGTRDIDDGQLEALLQEAGGRYNAHTHAYRTSYHCVMPTNQVSLALWLESNRMAHFLPALTNAKVREEKKTTSDEWRTKVDARAFGRSQATLWETLFPGGHPFQPAKPERIEALERQQVEAFVRRYHGPENASLVLVGDLPEDIREQVERDFGHRSGGEKAAPPKVSVSTPTKERRIVRRSELMANPVVMMAWTSPGLFERGDAEADVLARILSMELQQRAEEIAPGQFLDFEAHQSSELGLSVFTIAAEGVSSTAPQKMLDVMDELLVECLGEVTKARVEESKRAWRLRVVRGLQSLEARAEKMQLYIGAGKSPDWLDEDLARYEAVSVSSIATLVEGHLDPDQRVVLLAYPATEDDAE